MKLLHNLSVATSLLATMAIPAAASVVVNNPANNTEVTSPFHLSATAVSCSSEDVTSMGYSIDSSADTIRYEGKSLEIRVGMSAGTHTLHVKALSDAGTECVNDVILTVKDEASAASQIPPDATKASNIQAMRNWEEAHDTGGRGRSSGSTKLVSSPSLHGTTREFKTSYSGGGDERFSIRYADDTESKNFFYDAWVYFTNADNNIANLELDTNQAIGDGKVVIFGVQCDGYAGTWDFTENVGSVKHGRPHWKPASGTKCNPKEWTKNTWHHVQASYSRNENGKITYHSVWLDGSESKMNATVNGLFDLGWSPQINTQFQIDGRGSSGSTNAYLDNLTISRW